MKQFDVIIIGAGPAGLQCAHALSGSGLDILLIEKENAPGNKACAGGITFRDMEILDLPDDVVERKVTDVGIFSRLNGNTTQTPTPFVYTIDRKKLAAWQMNRIGRTAVTMLMESKVTAIDKNKVIVNGTDEYGYRFLVGADGYGSIVRKYLGLPLGDRLIGIQYRVPINGSVPRLEIHLHSKYFHSWYGWVFPHSDTLRIGACYDPQRVSSRKRQRRFEQWLDRNHVDRSEAMYESGPIPYDYRGFRFGNIFLTGDAGGFASGLTGEGIYQALVSGEAAARKIMDPDGIYEPLEEVIRYNRIQRKIMKVFYYAGPARNLIHELLIALMGAGPVKRKIHKGFTAADAAA